LEFQFLDIPLFGEMWNNFHVSPFFPNFGGRVCGSPRAPFLSIGKVHKFSLLLLCKITSCIFPRMMILLLQKQGKPLLRKRGNKNDKSNS